MFKTKHLKGKFQFDLKVFYLTKLYTLVCKFECYTQFITILSTLGHSSKLKLDKYENL